MEMSDSTEPPSRRGLALLGWASIVLLIVLIQESLFRLAFPIPEVANFNRILYSPTFLSPALRAAKPLMNVSLEFSSAPDEAVTVDRLNLYGFRGETWRWHAPTGVSRVAFVGDSIVEGVMAGDSETIPATFERRGLDRGAAVEALNWGVAGAELPQYFVLVNHAVPIFRPTDVVFVVFANRIPFAPFQAVWLARPLRPRTATWWMPRIFDVAVRTLAGQPVARRWRTGPLPVFAPVPDPSNPWTDAEHRIPGLPSPPTEGVDPELADAMRRGTFNPFLTHWLLQAETRFREAGDPTLELTRLKTYVEDFGTRLHVVYAPAAVQVSDYYLPFQRKFSPTSVTSFRGPEYQAHAATLATTCAKLGIPFLDLTPILRQQEDAGVHMYWDYDIHMRPAGYVTAGRAIHDWWKAETNP